jgi:DNA-binding GntR family transcriptional regulator
VGKVQYDTNSSTPSAKDELVADAIRSAILRGTFKPGEQLDQKQVCHDLGVSRGPVREALRTLAAEGLVTIIPNRGTTVTERSIEELDELHFIRSTLEGAAARRAAPKMDERRLERLATLFERADKTSDVDEILALNNEFHGTIYSAYPQPTLMRHIQQLRNKVAAYNRAYLKGSGNKEIAWAAHKRIYEACVRRDGGQAEAETIKHLEEVFQIIAGERRRPEAA